MCDQYLNNYLQEIELCIQLSRELNKEILENLKTLESNCEGEIDIDIDINSLRLAIKKVVDVENNIVLHEIINFIKINKTFLTRMKTDNDRELNLSIYIWCTEASDTPQIDLNNETLMLLGNVGVDLSLVIYTYKPD